MLVTGGTGHTYIDSFTLVFVFCWVCVVFFQRSVCFFFLLSQNVRTSSAPGPFVEMILGFRLRAGLRAGWRWTSRPTWTARPPKPKSGVFANSSRNPNTQSLRESSKPTLPSLVWIAFKQLFLRSRSVYFIIYWDQWVNTGFRFDQSQRHSGR